MAKLIRNFKLRMRSLNKLAHMVFSFYYQKIKHKGKILCIFLTPEQRNIGDIAITIAEKTFLNDFFPNYYIFEITDPVIMFQGKQFNRIIFSMVKNEKLFIQGGGFLGTLWFEYGELQVRKVLENTLNSDVTIFPQTIFYVDSDWGRSEFQKSKVLYNENKRLKVCLREKLSYDIAEKAYNNVFLIPDMVLYLNYSKEILQRSGVKICLRSDVEKTLSDNEYTLILNFAEKYFGDNIGYIDMLHSENILLNQRNDFMEKQIVKFKTAELVITDRLHGMILAAISGTPCIVVNSKSHKVKGCYEWIKNLPYVKFADDLNDLDNIINSISLSEKHEYSNEHLMKYYKELADTIKKG